MLRFVSILFAFFGLTAAQAQSPPSRVLIYGDSNSWGWQATPEGFPVARLSDAERWPGVAASILGAEATIVVDALSGRTTNVDHKEGLGTLTGAEFNGLRTLPVALARELPLDLVVIMLGTNDLRADVERAPEEIAAGAMALAERVRTLVGGVATVYPAPKVLVVTPPPLGDVSRTPIREPMVGSEVKSRGLAEAFAAAGRRAGISVVDAGRYTATDGLDGVHLTRENHAALGRGMAEEIRRALKRS